MDKKLRKYIPDADIYLYNTGAARKAWLCFGCTRIEELGLHRFVLWAPNARRVSVVGDFNGWNADAHPMEKLEGGVWAAFIPGLSVGSLYKYSILGADGSVVLKADPFASFSQCGPNTASVVWESSYSWRDGGYMSARVNRSFMHCPMSIYELHLGSWKALSGERPAYRELGESLAEYCHELGYTHVELLPITEYPYDGSWGYQVSGYYAPTSRYGTPDDFKYLVDTLHSAGIGVIMDWVPAHFPKDAHGLARFDGTPLFECKEKRMAEHPEWGTLIFDYASSQVQSFLVSSACRFFDEYHIDGIRVDAVSSMLYLNYARKPGEYTPNRLGGDINLDAVEFLKKLNSAVLTGYPGAITIAEEATSYPKITAPPADGGLGFCFKWDMGFMHDTLDYMALDPLFRGGSHNKLTFSMMYAFSENYVLAYSHDEVVHGKLSMLNKMSGDYDRKFASLRTLYGYQFGHPGKKLTFMGSEFGQFIEWNWKQELDWLLLSYPRHCELQRYFGELNSLYVSRPALYDEDCSWEGFKWLNVDDSDRSSVAFMRMSERHSDYVVCVCNFTPVPYEGFVIGMPMPGTLHELLNSDEYRFGGSGMQNKRTIYTKKEPFLNMKHSARLNLPPMSAVFFEFRPRKRKAEDNQ